MGQFLEIAAEKTRGLNWTSTNIANHPGVDKVDMRDLPTKYKENSFDGIYSEHFIEHIYRYQGINFFKEAHRILKPHGTIRTVWPPYEFIEKLVSDLPLTPEEQNFCAAYHRFYVIKHQFSPPGNKHRSIREQCALGLLYQNGQHLHVWSIKDMIETLKSLGFKNVKQHKYMDSRVMEFKNIDTPGHIRALHSAVVEATK